ncbi:MAG TPA: TRAP transporter fused permease subunit [Burkholderiales bacterium]|nr:TRAP transporter fused permease subunit [Burkholderiales bacterium]
MSDTTAPVARTRLVVEWLYYLTAVFFFGYLIVYYWTSEGGPVLLALTLVPVTFILHTLEALRQDEFYPRLPPAVRPVIATAYIAASIAVALYMHVEYEAIGTVRAGIWNKTDLAMGALMAVLVMEYTRVRHPALFVLNVLLILYAVYGHVVSGMFYHPGLTWSRIASAMSLEMTTGIFSNLPQLALTLIGSFILVLAALRAFGCVESLLKGSKQIAVRSAHALPQSAVVGSMAVGTVSGSGAANAITVGSATIPAMIGAGMPRVVAAAIETASSLGGQLMPPVMGIAAFLMAEFLGRSYFDVVARGYAPAIIYYIGVSVSVYLLSTRYRTRLNVVTVPPMTAIDWANIAAFVFVVAGLIGVMGVMHLAPMFAALYVFVAVGGVLVLAHLVMVMRSRGRTWRALIAPLGRFVDYFASMTADLTLLLATLSIMTGALVITGVPTKIGGILIQMAGVNLTAMVLVAFFFGALLGTGLPPAPTYIITALVIAPPIIKVGVDPWVVHFFAFFLAVWGEVTPPTSVSAAVTSKIANAPFLQTLFRAITICVSLFVLMAGVFTRPELVLEPGLAQLGAMFLITVATVGITFSIQARFAERREIDVPARLVLAAAALVVLLHPDRQLAWFTCIAVGLFVAYWILRRRNVSVIAQAGAARAAAARPPASGS